MADSPLLEGLLVIEFANVLAGPATGMFLAEQGARVIKVENPATGGDPTRGWTLPGEAAPGGVSGYFASTNWGKESIALDLRSAEGQAVARDLAARADVVLHSYKPGDEIRLGLDEPRLRRASPALIYGAISAYGPDDPRPGFDAIIQAEAGFMYLNGDPDGPPIKMPVALMDLLAAHQMKEAVLLALLRRERTGQGASIHVSLLQAGIAALANQASNWLMGGPLPQRLGSAHPNVVPYGTRYASANGDWIVLAVGTDRQFAALTRALEVPGLAEDPRFAANAERVRHREALDALLQQCFAARDTASLEQALAREGVPSAPIKDMAAVFAEPAAAACILTSPATADGASGTSARAVRTAVFTGDLPRTVPGAPPALGADGPHVLRELLGYADERIAALKSAGVVLAPGTDSSRGS